MKVTEIIKDAFQFPSKNTGKFAMYLLLSVLAVGFAFGGLLTRALGFNSENELMGGVYILIAMIIGIIISGYHIKLIKSGIDHDDEVPRFELFENFITGFDNVVVKLFYYIIPGILVACVAIDTNLFGNIIAIVTEILYQIINVYILGSSATVAANAITHSINNFLNSLTTTLIAASIVFFIFSFLQAMAEARLANTGSLKEALNVYESVKDLKRIGLVKVILVLLSIILVISIIELILAFLFSSYPFLLTVICVILTPYLALVVRRALGLLYSDIA